MTTKTNKFSCSDFKPAGCEPSLDQKTVNVWNPEHPWDSVTTISLKDIRIVHPSDILGMLDVVYVARVERPSGLTATEVRTGETSFDQLFIALGWHAGLEPKIQLATMASPRRR
jgi:hypothetical protein